jgi:hypothetical protein
MSNDDEKIIVQDGFDMYERDFLAKCAQGKLEEVQELSRHFQSKCIEAAAILSIINGHNLLAKFLVLSELGLTYLYSWSSRLVQFDVHYEERLKAFLQNDDKSSQHNILYVKNLTVEKCIERFGIQSLQAELQRRPNKPVPEKGDLVEKSRWRYDARFCKEWTWHTNLLSCIKEDDGKMYYEALDSQFQDLSSLLKSANPRFDMLTRMVILANVASGIFSLHCQNIGHGSISTSSILVKLFDSQQTAPAVKILTQSAMEKYRGEIVLSMNDFYPEGNFDNVMAWDVFAFAKVAREVVPQPLSSKFSITDLCNKSLQFQTSKLVEVRIWEFVWRLNIDILRFSESSSSLGYMNRRSLDKVNHEPTVAEQQMQKSGSVQGGNHQETLSVGESSSPDKKEDSPSPGFDYEKSQAVSSDETDRTVASLFSVDTKPVGRIIEKIWRS